jgi:hypothetical protein
MKKNWIPKCEKDINSCGKILNEIQHRW